jgi:hypothetical protein
VAKCSTLLVKTLPWSAYQSWPGYFGCARRMGGQPAHHGQHLNGAAPAEPDVVLHPRDILELEFRKVPSDHDRGDRQ